MTIGPGTAKLRVETALKAMYALADEIEETLIGRSVQVISDHNGQPSGRSRKSWRGEVRKITSVHIEPKGGISVALETDEYECFIPLREVEIL